MKYFLILFLNIFLISNFSFSEEIFGEAKVVDGDTLRIKKLKIIMMLKDEPELQQKFKKPYLQISSLLVETFNKDYISGKI